jgi:hypothetical protein
MVGMEAAQPLGMSDAITKDEMTGREFNVFVVLSLKKSKREGPGLPKEKGKAEGKGGGRTCGPDPRAAGLRGGRSWEYRPRGSAACRRLEVFP